MLHALVERLRFTLLSRSFPLMKTNGRTAKMCRGTGNSLRDGLVLLYLGEEREINISRSSLLYLG